MSGGERDGGGIVTLHFMNWIIDTKMDNRLSLVAAYDDLIRNARVLREGCEDDFHRFVLSQEDCRRRWQAAERKASCTRGRIDQLESENTTLETRLKNARSQIELEQNRRKIAEQDRDSVERQISVVRELLNDKNSKSIIHEQDREKLAALNRDLSSAQHGYDSPRKLDPILESSASLLSDISYDKTEEELDPSYLRSGRKWKRPSAPPMEDDADGPQKRRKNEDDNSVVTRTTITVDAAGKPVSAMTEVTVPKLNKSFSEPALDKYGQKTMEDRDADSEPETEDSWQTPHGRNTNYNANTNSSSKKPRSILKSTPKTPVLRKANSAGNGLNRVHVFISKTVIKPETCIPCGKRIKFGKLAMKCKDCRSACHPDCKDRLPLPCIPAAPSTPGTAKSSGGLLADYAPLDMPMIPALVIHCVRDVEKRGLNEVGLYRLSGSEREVKDLKEKFFKGKGMPNLAAFNDIHVVCGCLKDFLRGLKEPIVTYDLWNSFVQAAENPNKQRGRAETYEAINQLPQANRDTLAYLIVHLQKVAESADCKMPITNLAKVFGPTVVGYSSAEIEPMQMINETRKQSMVMLEFLQIPSEYWLQYLNIENTNMYGTQANTPNTPNGYSAPRSILGPVLTPGSYAEQSQVQVTRTPHTPRFGSKSKQPNKKPSHFFSAPFLE